MLSIGHEKNKNLSGVLAGLLVGGLIGAVLALLLAPQSGEEMRKQIRKKGDDLREQTADTVEEGVAQARAKAQQVTADIQEKAEALQQRGHVVVDRQKERWEPVIEAGKTAVNNA
jgi:gas vesicle protein